MCRAGTCPEAACSDVTCATTAASVRRSCFVTLHSSRDLDLSQLFCKYVEDQRHAITWLNLHRLGYWPLVGESKRSKMHCLLFCRLCIAPEVVDVCSNGLDCRRYHLAERLMLAAKPSAADGLVFPVARSNCASPPKIQLRACNRLSTCL